MGTRAVSARAERLLQHLLCYSERRSKQSNLCDLKTAQNNTPTSIRAWDSPITQLVAAGLEPRPLPRPMPLEAPQPDGLTMPLPQRVLLFVLVRPLPIATSCLRARLVQQLRARSGASRVESRLRQGQRPRVGGQITTQRDPVVSHDPLTRRQPRPRITRTQPLQTFRAPILAHTHPLPRLLSLACARRISCGAGMCGGLVAATHGTLHPTAFRPPLPAPSGDLGALLGGRRGERGAELRAQCEQAEHDRGGSGLRGGHAERAVVQERAREAHEGVGADGGRHELQVVVEEAELQEQQQRAQQRGGGGQHVERGAWCSTQRVLRERERAGEGGEQPRGGRGEQPEAAAGRREGVQLAREQAAQQHARDEGLHLGEAEAEGHAPAEPRARVDGVGLVTAVGSLHVEQRAPRVVGHPRARARGQAQRIRRPQPQPALQARGRGGGGGDTDGAEGEDADVHGRGDDRRAEVRDELVGEGLRRTQAEVKLGQPVGGPAPRQQQQPRGGAAEGEAERGGVGAARAAPRHEARGGAQPEA
eukprot:scaffold16245_cov67-Phaeocystis_antarctica.AAC.6